jgi:hypothetical protein
MNDIGTWLGLGGALALYLIVCLATGKVPSRGRLISRANNPGLFWFGITLPAAILFMMALGGSIWALAHAVRS